MSRRRAKLAALALLTCAWLLPDQLRAQDGSSIRAARLSAIEGSVSVLPDGTTAWTAAMLNRPLSAGDQVWSERGARAEIDFGTVTLRLSSGTGISVLTLSDEGVQVAVNAGTVQVAVHDTGTGQWTEIDAPSVAMSVLTGGNYRISAGHDGGSMVSVDTGRAQLASRASESLILRNGQGAQFAADGTMDIATPEAADEFDRWCAAREARWQRENNDSPYVSDEVPGSGQLKDAGQWDEEPDIGEVWFPAQVPQNWAPYQNGQWLYVPAWGWTWMDLAPWGFAPFHYGRWARIGGRWAWIPPPRHTHPVFTGAPSDALRNVAGDRPVATSSLRVVIPPNSPRHSVFAMRNPAVERPTMPRVQITPASRSVLLSTPPPMTLMPPVGPTIHARDVRPADETQNAAARSLEPLGRDEPSEVSAPEEPRRGRRAPIERQTRFPVRETPGFAHPASPVLQAPPVPQAPPLPKAPPVPRAAPVPQTAPSVFRSVPRQPVPMRNDSP